MNLSKFFVVVSCFMSCYSGTKGLSSIPEPHKRHLGWTDSKQKLVVSGAHARTCHCIELAPDLLPQMGLEPIMSALGHADIVQPG